MGRVSAKKKRPHYDPASPKNSTRLALGRSAGSALLAYQTEVGTWARSTFPLATKESWVAHLRKEVAELAESHDPQEAADCLILLLGHAHINGYDLLLEAQAKMEINRRRKWGEPDAEGVVEHVPNASRGANHGIPLAVPIVDDEQKESET